MDLRKKTNPFVENAKASETSTLRRKSLRGMQQMESGKTAAQRFKERYKTKKRPKIRPGDIGSGIAGSYNR
jgi:hypothetical protein